MILQVDMELPRPEVESVTDANALACRNTVKRGMSSMRPV